MFDALVQYVSTSLHDWVNSMTHYYRFQATIFSMIVEGADTFAILEKSLIEGNTLIQDAVMKTIYAIPFVFFLMIIIVIVVDLIFGIDDEFEPVIDPQDFENAERFGDALVRDVNRLHNRNANRDMPQLVTMMLRHFAIFFYKLIFEFVPFCIIVPTKAIIAF
eukprot:UN22651